MDAVEVRSIQTDTIPTIVRTDNLIDVIMIRVNSDPCLFGPRSTVGAKKSGNIDMIHLNGNWGSCANAVDDRGGAPISH